MSSVARVTFDARVSMSEEPEGPVAYTMTLGVTADAEGVYAPNANIEGLAKVY